MFKFHISPELVKMQVLGLSLVLTLTIFVGLGNSHIPYEDIPDTISNEIESLKTGTITNTLTKVIKEVGKIKDKKVAKEVFCETCEVVIDQIISYRQSGASKESMTDYFWKLCNAFTDWGSVACNGYINIEIDTSLFILDNRKDITAKRICGIYFQKNGCTDPKANNWVVPIPTLRHRNKHHHPHPHVVADPLKILHLTDFHYDPLYTPGSKSVCNVPLCCQSTNGKATNASQAAGQWGDYQVCDTPWHSITNFTAYLTNSKEKYDFVYYTGDIISHKSWASDKDGNTKAIKQLFQHFKDTFGNVTVYPILGNHEPHPTDFWSYSGGKVNITPSVSTQWVFDLMASEWGRWLPQNTTETIKNGGYYTVLVAPKLRIIALNSNVCFVSNLWLLYEDEDPYGQLKWLVKVLSQAEKSGEIVHILSHIPPGELLCHQRWSNQFRKIVQRFAPIIAAQFNGHTHLDELRLFRDTNNTKKVINVAFNAGSFTTFVGFNPNYRTYQVNSTDYRVLDYDHYTYNLTKANQNPTKSPQWYKLYSFKEAYGLKDTTNESFEDLLARMPKNKTLLQQYWRFQGRDSPVFLKPGCDDLCLKKKLCTITAVETIEILQCTQLTRQKTHHKV